jgi:hypothetical protein
MKQSAREKENINPSKPYTNAKYKCLALTSVSGRESSNKLPFN